MPWGTTVFLQNAFQDDWHMYYGDGCAYMHLKADNSRLHKVCRSHRIDPIPSSVKVCCYSKCRTPICAKKKISKPGGALAMRTLFFQSSKATAVPAGQHPKSSTRFILLEKWKSPALAKGYFALGPNGHIELLTTVLICIDIIANGSR